MQSTARCQCLKENPFFCLLLVFPQVDLYTQTDQVSKLNDWLEKKKRIGWKKLKNKTNKQINTADIVRRNGIAYVAPHVICKTLSLFGRTRHIVTSVSHTRLWGHSFRQLGASWIFQRQLSHRTCVTHLTLFSLSLSFFTMFLDSSIETMVASRRSGSFPSVGSIFI